MFWLCYVFRFTRFQYLNFINFHLRYFETLVWNDSTVCRLGERQVVNLVKIVAFCRDMKLTETRQADLRRQCLVYWDVPDQARREDKTSCDELASKRLQKYGDTGKC